MKTLLALASILASFPAHAAGHFRAEPETAARAGHLVVRDLYWRCDAGVCTAGQSASRPAIVCALRQQNDLFVAILIAGSARHLPCGTKKPDHVRMHEGDSAAPSGNANTHRPIWLEAEHFTKNRRRQFS